jgi:alkylated DNA nucleotide flippase Atl1
MTRHQRSLQIWMLLVVAAKERKSYTYGDIAKMLGMGGAGVLAQFLGPIMWYCDDQKPKLPPLTVLVVNQDTGLPGEGLTTLENVNEDRERVFAYDWFSIEPPETKQFEAADRVLGSALRSFRHNINEDSEA